ncbi:family 20 glycosylhydrolase [uncultured Alistipes sp.]|uniref:glycoside hydrolase family 20 protein n=1 Tax=uncultured Alistipes sp. TaxID=538949 RepID=UPI0025E5E0F4|nr:family 20 glycosylhydrolase [uncultured Alistipes sp.]
MKKHSMLTGLIALALGLASCSADRTGTADYRVVPLPNQIALAEGARGFALDPRTEIGYTAGNAAMERNAELLADYLADATGYRLTVTDTPAEANAIVLTASLDDANAEAYRIEVGADGIRIDGASEAGVFYGIQTLRKAMPVEPRARVVFPAATIYDFPRFAYRGAHFDVSRHFFSVREVKRFIDMLALHNINRFHWHLTDDQGWRIEIKAYPELTTVGATRPETVIGHNSGKYDGTPHGGFYTQDEVRDIVAYAAERHITVIPEIDLPGHMQAALAAYPELGCTGGPYEVWKIWGISDHVLCAGNDKVLKFIDDVLAEVVELFPSEYIHVGGDECPKVRWKSCPKCQARIRALGLKSDAKHSAEERLQSYIISYAERLLNAKGRRIIGWDEILEGGLAPNATVHSWRGIEGGVEAARQGHDVIMSPTSFFYFDYYQTKDTQNEPEAIGGYVPVEKVYSFDPNLPELLTADQARHIIGVQANLWTEYIPTFAQVEYMELPRMAALAEVQWMQPEQKDFADFKRRLPRLVALYDRAGYNYARHIFDVEARLVPDTERRVLTATLTTIDDAPIRYTLDGSEPDDSSALYEEPLSIDASCTLRAAAFRPSGHSRVFGERILFNKASMKPIELLQPINPQYSFEGKGTLVDGLSGNGNYKTGRWIAFVGNDLEAVVDLGEATEIRSAGINTCVEKGDWVFDTRGLSVAISDDGKRFREVASEVYPAMQQSDPNGVHTHTLAFEPVTTRYVKVTALSEHAMPSWHGGHGRPGYLFVDEITIE